MERLRWGVGLVTWSVIVGLTVGAGWGAIVSSYRLMLWMTDIITGG